MKYFGIDPGLSGYICILDNNYNYDFIKIPIITIEKNNLIDIKKLFVDINGIVSNDDICILENQHSFANMSMQSMFKLGRVFGNIESITSLLFNDVIYVSPQKWQNELSKKYLNDNELELIKNEKNFMTLINNIDDDEFKTYLLKRTEQKSFKFTKIKAVYLFDKIINKYEIKNISYTNHNLIDSFLISFYGLTIKRVKNKINLQKMKNC